MSSIIATAFIWLLGDPDLLKLLCCFTLSIGVIHTIFKIWHTVEGEGRNYF